MKYSAAHEPVRVLMVHNAYQHRGGEDSVVDSEIALLSDNGHPVELFSRNNSDISAGSRLGLVFDTIWSRRSARELQLRVVGFKPDVIHVHNTFPLISPSIYWAAAGVGIPVVQTLHNFRLHCPQAMYLRDGRVCEACQGHLPWRAVTKGCYRGSRAQSAVLASMLALHRGIGTWQHKVTRYIALNEFCRQKFIAGGLPADRLVVKPNFVEAAPYVAHAREGFLFVGRLSSEKGVAVLAGAAQQLPGYDFKVAGGGPERRLLESLPHVALLGALDAAQVHDQMLRARALVLPSVWFENFPRTIVEAFAAGLPVIASRIGALAEIVEEGVTGLLFEPGNSADLAKKLAWAQSEPEAMKAMGERARALYQERYSPDSNYRQLLGIYDAAVSAVQDRT